MTDNKGNVKFLEGHSFEVPKDGDDDVVDVVNILKNIKWF